MTMDQCALSSKQDRHLVIVKIIVCGYIIFVDDTLISCMIMPTLQQIIKKSELKSYTNAWICIALTIALSYIDITKSKLAIWSFSLISNNETVLCQIEGVWIFIELYVKTLYYVEFTPINFTDYY